MSSPYFSPAANLRSTEIILDWTKFISGLFTPGEERWIRHNLIAKICSVTPGNTISDKLCSHHGLDRSPDFVSKFLALGGAVTPTDLPPNEVVALGRRLIKEHPAVFSPVEFFALAGHSVYGKVPEMFSSGSPRIPVTAEDFRTFQRRMGELSTGPTPLEELARKEAADNLRVLTPALEWLRNDVLAREYLKLGKYSPTSLAASWGLKPDRVEDLAKHKTDLTTDEALALIKRRGLSVEAAFALTKPSVLAQRDFLSKYQQRFGESARPFDAEQLGNLLSKTSESLAAGKLDLDRLGLVKAQFRAEQLAQRNTEKEAAAAAKLLAKKSSPPRNSTFRALTSVQIIDQDGAGPVQRDMSSPILTVNLGSLRHLLAEATGRPSHEISDATQLPSDAMEAQMFLLKLTSGFQSAACIDQIPDEVGSIGALKEYLRSKILDRWAKLGQAS